MMREKWEEGAKVTTSLWAVLACAWSWCPGGCECVCAHMHVLTILCLAHRTPLRSELPREGLVGPLAAGGGLHKSSQQALEDQVAAIL